MVMRGFPHLAAGPSPWPPASNGHAPPQFLIILCFAVQHKETDGGAAILGGRWRAPISSPAITPGSHHEAFRRELLSRGVWK